MNFQGYEDAFNRLAKAMGYSRELMSPMDRLMDDLGVDDEHFEEMVGAEFCERYPRLLELFEEGDPTIGGMIEVIRKSGR